MAGFVRFGLFVAILALVGLGYYSHSLGKTVADQRAAIAAPTSERDALRSKASTSEKQASDSASALQDALSRVQSLQTELEEAKKPARGRRT